MLVVRGLILPVHGPTTTRACLPVHGPTATHARNNSDDSGCVGALQAVTPKSPAEYGQAIAQPVINVGNKAFRGPRRQVPARHSQGESCSVLVAGLP